MSKVFSNRSFSIERQAIFAYSFDKWRPDLPLLITDNACEYTTAVPPTVTPSTPVVVTDVRLPTALEPILYDVELQANMYMGDPTNFTFEGYVHIKMRVNSATNNITLHINKLTIDNSSLSLTEDDGGSAPNIDHYDLDLARQFIIFHLDANLETDKEYTIKINFVGPLTDDLVGLYLSSYERGNDTVWVKHC